MMLTREMAIELIKEAKTKNPGPWVNHSFYVAKACEIIAKACHLDHDKAYLCGLLHDIGRREGVYDLHHVMYGYQYLKDLGYDEYAKICLTHSFVDHSIDDFNGDFDCSDEEIIFLRNYIENTTYDYYDKIVQLCDYLALPNGFCILEKRMIDVALRRGVNEFTIPKWKKVFALKEEIEDKASASIYSLLPNIKENL